MASNKDVTVVKSFETEAEACEELLREVEQKIKQFDGILGPQSIHIFVKQDENDGKFYVTDLSSNPVEADAEDSNS